MKSQILSLLGFIIKNFLYIFLPFYKIFQRDQKMNSVVLMSVSSKKIWNFTSSKTALNHIILINLLPYNVVFKWKITILKRVTEQTKRFIF